MDQEVEAEWAEEADQEAEVVSMMILEEASEKRSEGVRIEVLKVAGKYTQDLAMVGPLWDLHSKTAIIPSSPTRSPFLLHLSPFFLISIFYQLFYFRNEWRRDNYYNENRNNFGMGTIGAAGAGGMLGYALGGMRGPDYGPHHHGPGHGPGGGGYHHGPHDYRRSPMEMCWSCITDR